MAKAVRDLMTHLRDTGQIEGGGPSRYHDEDRSKFLDGLERLIQALKINLTLHAQHGWELGEAGR